MTSPDKQEPQQSPAPGAGPGCGGPGGGRYRRSVLEVAILSSLAEATAHGYNLVDQIEMLTKDLVCIDPGSMYRLLRSMEEDGLVTSAWQTQGSGPSRRVYTISDRGVEVLEIMAVSLAQRAASMQRLADQAVQAVARARAEGASDS